ncbi:phage holin family protein [Nocardia cyriacigeorgica]|uniref:phage holin family protein n=1 Tax=Nocardia cyriacigeorgica TaxID=135487 RepID=UPI001895662D|nr:phage holin family protein [Nocardia cyriacigeorgica]MBF6083217.1 phage holin family protein [Nocardia cyriacigeorgica]MBF6427016.1 phage holin family protein [Nocardia cyriacigeorgica]MBF6498713.1 phage holin family protein [Nocardia cyriacigeorgica]
MAETYHAPSSQTRSISELVDDATTQLSRLVRDEIRLARIEMQDRTKGIATGVGLAGAAGVLAFYGGGALIAAAVLALALVLPGWAAALIVGGALLVVAAVLGLLGKKNVSEATPPIPREAVAGVREDLDVVKEWRRE